MDERKVIPIAPAPVEPEGDCSGAEPFALMVLGDSMAPEFADGEIIIVEPDGIATDGSYVVAQVEGEWTMRQLARTEDGWELRALDPAYPATAIAGLDAVRGVVIQKSRPGSRRAARRYVE
ncbi:DNA polymerase V [Burkholderiales bacterium]|nr:DNA polymerase V [Burkholderiales bacterium]